MLKLFCAIVGVSGSSFHVDIDENETVGDLKDAIKDKKPLTITCEADQLQLFLAKTTDGAWLTENDVKKGVKDTSGLTPLEFANVPLNLDDLSEEEVRVQLTKDDFKAGNGPVHVLVAVPNHVRVNIGGTSSRALKYMRTYSLAPNCLNMLLLIVLCKSKIQTVDHQRSMLRTSHIGGHCNHYFGRRREFNRRKRMFNSSWPLSYRVSDHWFGHCGGGVASVMDIEV
ncbi:Crinkler (CRN) [Phytophthora megakarya]|uniref:Crinkler (CRN) n=1 Tax=Phytophthora megakarya TaxID=4795 RepID=A0A225UTW6_9STRA|nr:Crinkler (CRN) [Phytophthora megakarya]